MANLFQGQSTKKAQLHYLGGAGIFLLQFFQRFVNEQEGVIISIGGDLDLVQINPLPVATSFLGALAPCPLDQDTTHRFGGRRKKVRAIGERRIGIAARQTQPGLVNERGGLQRVAGSFIGHARASKLAEFVIDQGQEFARRISTPLLRTIKNEGNSAHTC